MLAKFRKWTLIIALTALASSIFAQESEKNRQRRLFYQVLDHIYEEQYEQALPILFHLDTIQLEAFVKNPDKRFYKHTNDTVSIEKIYIKYLIAACYFEEGSETQKPLEYIEFVLQAGYSQTPEIVYKDLGDLYHRDYQFDKAIFYYNKFLSETDPADYFYPYVKNMLQVSEQAQELVKDTLKTPIYKLGSNLNSSFSEEQTYITQDNRHLLFARVHYQDNARELKIVAHYSIMLSQKEFGIWKRPKALQLQLPAGYHHYRLAGISPNAARVYLALYKEPQGTGDLFVAQRYNYQLTELQPLRGLNTEADENFITEDAQNQVLYFSSNRPGGQGKYDIYTASKDRRGRWGKVKNMGDAINTPGTETAPFKPQDSPVLYFSSDGHNTMGGLDILYSTYQNNHWITPKNMGFPVNTVVDNIGISVNAPLNKVYFTLENAQNYLNKDIYTTNMQQGIPYTVLNGLLISNNRRQPVAANIEVYSSNQNETLIITRQPNEQGNYYVFFPPGQEYKMYIKARGYQPRLIKFKVPPQNYFYELQQHIEIEPITVLNEQVGERFVVKNLFQDLASDTTTQPFFDTREYDKDVERLTGIIESIKAYEVAAGRQSAPEREEKYEELLDFVDQAIEEEDHESLHRLKTKAHYDQTAISTTFYDQDTSLTLVDEPNDAIIDMTENQINAQVVTPDSMIRAHELKVTDSLPKSYENDYPQAKQKIFTYSLFFDHASYTIAPANYSKLNEVARFLLNHPRVQAEIHGYSNFLGEEEPNMKLSQKRADAVYSYLISQNLSNKRFKRIYHGEMPQAPGQFPAEYRRVDITLIIAN